MQIANINGVDIHYAHEGNYDAPVMVFVNSLGSDLRLWDNLVSILEKKFCIIRYDKQGHGSSGLANTSLSIAMLSDDLAGLMGHLKIKNAVICGISVGGMIAQCLTCSNPELVKALILCDTTPKIGNAEMWSERIADIDRKGLSALSDMILERWFSAKFRIERADELEQWRQMLTQTPKAGYLAICNALKNADLTDDIKSISCPTLCMVGDEDLSTPPQAVQLMASMINGSRFEIIEGAGHLPCIEKPDILAKHIYNFCEENGLAQR